jgi:hypothetical protein
MIGTGTVEGNTDRSPLGRGPLSDPEASSFGSSTLAGRAAARNSELLSLISKPARGVIAHRILRANSHLS